MRIWRDLFIYMTRNILGLNVDLQRDNQWAICHGVLRLMVYLFRLASLFLISQSPSGVFRKIDSRGSGIVWNCPKWTVTMHKFRFMSVSPNFGLSNNSKQRLNTMNVIDGKTKLAAADFLFLPDLNHLREI